MRSRVCVVAGVVSAMAYGAVEAQAATVYTYWRDHVGYVPHFLAASGEQNDLRMTGLDPSGTSLRTRLEDSGALLIHPLNADYLGGDEEVASLNGTLENCEYAVVSATCSHDRAVVASLGDGDDTATVVNAFEFTVRGEAGDDTAVSDGTGFSFVGGPGADTLAGGGTFYYLEEPGVSVDMHIDFDGVADDGRPGEADNLHPDVRGVRIWLDGNHTVVASAGDNHIEARVGSGDVNLSGLAGDDNISAGGGDDMLSGGPGRDILGGGFGNDTIVLGPGLDNVAGGPGDDVIDARDGERDGNISCQSGVDTAYVDPVDTLVHDCENVIVG